jgi:hypothetical protein
LNQAPLPEQPAEEVVVAASELVGSRGVNHVRQPVHGVISFVYYAALCRILILLKNPRFSGIGEKCTIDYQRLTCLRNGPNGVFQQNRIFRCDPIAFNRNAVPVRKIPRSMLLLLSQVNDVGNLGQHQRADTKGTVDVGFMAANCFATIQLAEQLVVALKS